jgi:hypothetical protein
MINDLDEAIKHCEEKAKRLRTEAEQVRNIGELISNPKYPYNEPVKNCLECAKEHEQLAEWLKELKSFKEGQNSQWIPVTYRPMTEEEEKELCEKLGIEEGSLEDWEKRVFTCHLPDDGQEILTSFGRYVQEDICSWDEYGCGLENNGDWDGIDAWMPKPEPYKKEGAV